MSSLIEPTLQYKGFVQEWTGDYRKTTETWVGSLEQLKEKKNAYSINTAYEYGTLENIRITQIEGPFYNLELVFSVTYINGRIIMTGSAYGIEKSQLTSRMMSIPIEAHKKWKRKWSYNLYTTYPKGQSTPGWWDTDDIDSDNTDGDNYNRYCWAKSINECPQVTENATSQKILRWRKMKSMTKPGVESYSYPVYEITEHAKVSKQNQVGIVLHKKAGDITDPENGDFGIKEKYGGDWLCEGGSVEFDGKYWVVSLTYTWSPDGWDKQLYN